MTTVYAFLLIAVPLAVAATAIAVGYVGLRLLVAELSSPREPSPPHDGQASPEP